MQFKTLLQLVQDHIQATANLVHDLAAALQNNQNLRRRISERMASDPALYAFTTHFSQTLALTLRAIPPELQMSTIQYLLIQVVTESLCPARTQTFAKLQTGLPRPYQSR